MSKKISTRTGRDGRKIPIKVTMRRHLKEKLEPKAEAKRQAKRELTEKQCFICSETKDIEHFKSKITDSFSGELRQELRGLCIPCESKRRRLRDDDDWQGEEFTSPYANAYALGHSFDDNLSCTASGCNVTFAELQDSLAKCKGVLAGKKRICEKKMTKAVTRVRKY